MDSKWYTGKQNLNIENYLIVVKNIILNLHIRWMKISKLEAEKDKNVMISVDYKMCKNRKPTSVLELK